MKFVDTPEFKKMDLCSQWAMRRFHGDEIVTKICPRCKIEKPIEEFSRCRAQKDKLQYYCKTCIKAKAKIYYQQNKDKLITHSKNYWKTRRSQKRNNDLKLKYGITLESYNKMLKQQDYKCAICQEMSVEIHPRSKKQLPLAVDHCHTTNKVRGLLCRNCNQKLGIYEKYKEKFRLYLECFDK